MKTIFNSKRHHYVAIVSIFLIAAALIAEMGGCDGGGGVKYDLTIASTAGGSVTTPSEGTFTYDEGIIVDLVAEAEEDYQFFEWTGDAGTIADVNAATTTITIASEAWQSHCPPPRLLRLTSSASQRQRECVIASPISSPIDGEEFYTRLCG